jgi:hypothetical protein
MKTAGMYRLYVANKFSVRSSAVETDQFSDCALPDKIPNTINNFNMRWTLKPKPSEIKTFGDSLKCRRLVAIISATWH